MEILLDIRNLGDRTVQRVLDRSGTEVRDDELRPGEASIQQDAKSKSSHRGKEATLELLLARTLALVVPFC